jgi:hypothetical protein
MTGMDEAGVPAKPEFRARGLLVMLALVLVGLSVSAGYFFWSLTSKASATWKIIDARKREIAEAPTTPEGRLAHWLVFGAPQIHHSLEMMRFSAAQPWLVTHAVRAGGAEEGNVEIYGIDLSGLPVTIARVEGSTVHVKLPMPRRLAVGPLTGDNAVSVPVAARADLAPDPVERAKFLVHYALDRLFDALERDIPGAKIAIEIGPEASFEEISAGPAAK